MSDDNMIKNLSSINHAFLRIPIFNTRFMEGRTTMIAYILTFLKHEQMHGASLMDTQNILHRYHTHMNLINLHPPITQLLHGET